MEKGSYTTIRAGEGILGCALRTKDNVKPVFISLGHLMGFKDALYIAVKCAIKYKLPEPTRLTHNLVNAFRKGEISEN